MSEIVAVKKPFLQLNLVITLFLLLVHCGEICASFTLSQVHRFGLNSSNFSPFHLNLSLRCDLDYLCDDASLPVWKFLLDPMDSLFSSAILGTNSVYILYVYNYVCLSPPLERELHEVRDWLFPFFVSLELSTVPDRVSI